MHTVGILQGAGMLGAGNIRDLWMPATCLILLTASIIYALVDLSNQVRVAVDPSRLSTMIAIGRAQQRPSEDAVSRAALSHIDMCSTAEHNSTP